jgi:wyosine [tRNA(Phe)-imidazoG37] synthetase (radical SAM superfamily)
VVDRAVAHPPIAFGPVLSRRLGWSLGINNVRPKSCTYACVYCQLGPTDRATSRRAVFHDPGEVIAAVLQRAEQVRSTGQQIDVATFVPDGEPTLDLGLEASVRGIRSAGLRVAVITNGSLCWDKAVRDALGQADLVSVKVDTVDETTWHRLNRPLRHLSLPDVLEGVRRFAASYRGELVTETMLVAGVNDDEATVALTASFVGALGPLRAYLTIPTRPPTEPWVRAPSRAAALRAADGFRAAELPVTCLLEDLEAPFGADREAIESLLGIVAVHPMTEEDARGYLERSGADWSVALKLLGEGLIVRAVHDGRVYLRRAPWN